MHVHKTVRNGVIFFSDGLRTENPHFLSDLQELP